MNVGIYIGRFQPLHIGHITIIAYMQKKYDHIIVLVGSANQRASTKNPFSFAQRKQWLEQSFSELTGEDSSQKISVLPLNDYRYNEAKWEAELNAQVESATTDKDTITLVGHEKDDSSYYLKNFSQWAYDSVPQSIKISATPIRNSWFTNNLAAYEKFLPPYVATYLTEQKANHAEIFSEYEFFEDEKQKFEKYPYPETLKLTTSDSVVVCQQKVLLVKRGAAPGKNCWALPGGYVNRGERFLAGAIRELLEETQLDVVKHGIKFVDSHLFDDPKRSFGIDRVTVGHYFTIDGQCPKATASDDAVDAKWVEFSHIKNINMFDDHADIIDHFLDIL